MKINKISQIDSRWRNTLLGNSKTSTIGQAGCLLSSISMLLGLDTPLTLNNNKSNFSVGNGLWLWSAINKYGGKYNGVFNYSKTKLDELAKKYGGVIVAVSFKPKGTTVDHYVVYLNDGTVYNSGTTLDKVMQKGFGDFNPLKIYDQVPNKDGKIGIPLNNPSYNTGLYSLFSANMNLRTGAGTNFANVKVKNTTQAMRNCLTSKNDNDNAIVKKGTNLTALEIVTNKDGSVWFRGYSGYTCIKGAAGTIYCKKY